MYIIFSVCTLHIIIILITLVWMRSRSVDTHLSADVSTLIAQRPIALTALRTKSTSTSVAYLQILICRYLNILVISLITKQKHYVLFFSNTEIHHSLFKLNAIVSIFCYCVHLLSFWFSKINPATQYIHILYAIIVNS